MNKVINTDLTEVQKTALQDWLRAEYTDLPLMLNSFFERVKTHQIDFEDSGENQHLAQEVRNSIQRIKEKLKILLNTEKDGSIVVKSSLIQIFDAHLCFEYRRIFPLISKTEIQFVNCEFPTTKEDLPIGWEGSGRVFEKRLFFHDCTFGDFISFSSSIFKEVVEFNNSTFMNSCDFHECTFEKNACFYGVDFKGVPNFSQANFLQKINLVNTNLNFSFEECKKLVESEKERRINQRANTIKMGKPITGAQIANDFRDSFRLFKGNLIDEHNQLDATNYRKIELYFKEIEMKEAIKARGDGEEDKQDSCELKVSQKIRRLYKRLEAKINFLSWNISTIIEQNLLYFYRTLSDHHTDLTRSINATIAYIAFNCIFLLLFKNIIGVLGGDSKDIEKTASVLLFFYVGIIVLCLSYFLCKTGVKKTIANHAFWISLCLFVFLFVFLAQRNDFFLVPFVLMAIFFYLLMLYFYFRIMKFIITRSIFVSLAYVAFIVFFCLNPYIVAPVLENSDKSEMYNYFMKEYIQNTSFDRLKGVVQQCEKLDRQIDWSRNQYSQIKQVLLGGSTILLTDEICANQTNLDLSITVFKNWIFNNVLKIIHVVYSIVLALFVFSLIKTARKNSIIPS